LIHFNQVIDRNQSTRVNLEMVFISTSHNEEAVMRDAREVFKSTAFLGPPDTHDFPLVGSNYEGFIGGKKAP
jgi:hypothetical protein